MNKEFKWLSYFFFALAAVEFIAISGRYVALYFIETRNPLRNEYLEGAILGVIYPLVPWILAAVFGFLAKNTISKKSLWLLCSPILVLIGGFVCLNLYIVVLAAVVK